MAPYVAAEMPGVWNDMAAKPTWLCHCAQQLCKRAAVSPHQGTALWPPTTQRRHATIPLAPSAAILVSLDIGTTTSRASRIRPGVG